MHRQTEYGKGDANRSDFSKFQSNFENIDFGHVSVFEQEDGWYFWDVTFSNAIGPFNSRQSANINLKLYAESI